MDPRLTKFLALLIPMLVAAPSQPDIAALIAPHPIWSYVTMGLIYLAANYLGIGLSGPTAAPRIAAALGNPPGITPPKP
jgi:hypothetical protein